MLFKKRSLDIDKFVNDLSQEMSKRYPPELERGESKRKISPQGLTNILEGVFNKATVFSTSHSLGWFTKARLTNKFRWRLDDLGYSSKFIDLATEGLIVYLTKNKSTNSSKQV